MPRSAKKRHAKGSSSRNRARQKRQGGGRNAAQGPDGDHTYLPGQEEVPAPLIGENEQNDRDDEQLEHGPVESADRETSDVTIDSDTDDEEQHCHPFVRAAIKSAKAVAAWRKGHANWKEAFRARGKMPYVPKPKCLQAIEYLDPSLPESDAETVDDKRQGYSTAYIRATIEKELKKEAWQELLDAAVMKELGDDDWEYFRIALLDDVIESHGGAPKGPEETTEFAFMAEAMMGLSLETMITNRAKVLVEARVRADLQAEFNSLEQIGEKLSKAKDEANDTHLKDFAEGRTGGCLKAVDELEQAVKSARKQIAEFKEDLANGNTVSRSVQHHAARVSEGFTWGPSPRYGGPPVLGH